VHKNKRKKDNDECRLVIVFFGCIERKQKKDHYECQLVIIFSRCIERKQKKTMMSAGLLSSSLGAHKKNNDKHTYHCHFLWVYKNKTKKG
jgi:hypothetical protein